MKNLKIIFGAFLFLSIGNIANAGCLRCSDGHVICHGSCLDPFKGSAKDVLGKQFCAPNSNSSLPLSGWGFDLGGRAYPLNSHAGIPDPGKYMTAEFPNLESNFNWFEIWEYETATGKGTLVGKFSFWANSGAIFTGNLHESFTFYESSCPWNNQSQSKGKTK